MAIRRTVKRHPAAEGGGGGGRDSEERKLFAAKKEEYERGLNFKRVGEIFDVENLVKGETVREISMEEISKMEFNSPIANIARELEGLGKKYEGTVSMRFFDYEKFFEGEGVKAYFVKRRGGPFTKRFEFYKIIGGGTALALGKVIECFLDGANLKVKRVK